MRSLAERARVDAVERRGLVEANERVGDVPVAAGPIGAFVDERDGGVFGLVED